MLFSPSNHPNLELNSEEIVAYRKSSIAILILEILAIGCFIAIDIDIECIVYAGLSIISCAFLMVLAKIFRQEAISKDKEE